MDELTVKFGRAKMSHMPTVKLFSEDEKEYTNAYSDYYIVIKIVPPKNGIVDGKEVFIPGVVWLYNGQKITHETDMSKWHGEEFKNNRKLWEDRLEKSRKAVLESIKGYEMQLSHLYPAREMYNTLLGEIAEEEDFVMADITD